MQGPSLKMKEKGKQQGDDASGKDGELQNIGEFILSCHQAYSPTFEHMVITLEDLCKDKIVSHIGRNKIIQGPKDAVRNFINPKIKFPFRYPSSPIPSESRYRHIAS